MNYDNPVKSGKQIMNAPKSDINTM